jgi:hypothetical protein
MNQIARIVPASTVTLKAWTVAPESDGNRRHEAQPRELPEWIESPEDAAKACCDCLTHKSAVIILRTDMAERPERRHLLHVYTVRKRTQRGYRRDANDQLVREPAEYPDFVMAVCVGEGFSPSEPWRWANGCDAVGNDKTLVEI